MMKELSSPTPSGELKSAQGPAGVHKVASPVGALVNLAGGGAKEAPNGKQGNLGAAVSCLKSHSGGGYGAKK